MMTRDERLQPIPHLKRRTALLGCFVRPPGFRVWRWNGHGREEG